jgi:EAL domain-containing protein (putative c-di-GMP-specific phosphodiesterase class I)
VKPNFYFQKIYDAEGKVCGIEILARDFHLCPYTDIYVFYSALEEVQKLNLSVPAHINLYASSIRYVRWDEIAREFGNKIVVEILETNVGTYVYDVEYLMSEGLLFALDDFGSGASNFSVLREVPFPIVKVDADLVPPGTAKSLKEELGVGKVIAEKTTSYPADAFQCFELHVPEPLSVLKEVSVLKEE